MDVRRAYCSAVDHSVPVVVRKGASVGRRLTVESPVALMCLDYPTRCTGWCCPLHAAEEARATMAEEARSAGAERAAPGPDGGLAGESAVPPKGPTAD